MQSKYEVPDHIKTFVNASELQTGYKVKALRSDRGGEYMSEVISTFFKEKGIVHQKTAPYTPQQNGVAERYNRTVLDAIRAIIYQNNIAKELWGELLTAFTYIKNRVLHSNDDSHTPFEKLFNKRPEVSHLRVLGSTCYYPNVDIHGKLEPRALIGVLVGYEEEGTNYRIWDGRQIIVRKRIITKEQVQKDGPPVVSEALWILPSGDEEQILLDPVPEPNNNLIPNPSANDPILHPGFLRPPSTGEPSSSTQALIPNAPGAPLKAPAPQEVRENFSSPDIPTQRLWRSSERLASQTMTTEQSMHAAVMYTEENQLNTPVTYSEAMSGSDALRWKEACNDEIKSLIKNKTWTLVPLPSGNRALTCKWVFRIKTDAKGNIQKYKARLVAKGFLQIEGVEFYETFSPVTKFTSVRILVAMAATFDWPLFHMDVKTAFLNGDLQETIYMKQPEGYEDPDHPNFVCLLQKSLYGLKQAPRCWFTKLKETLEKTNYTNLLSDPSVFVHRCDEGTVYLVVYVDDLLITGSNTDLIDTLKLHLSNQFEMTDLGVISRYVGIDFCVGPTGIFLNQAAYLQQITEKYLQTAPTAHPTTPLATNLINVDSTQFSDSELATAAIFPYRELLGSLMFAMVCTRPDLAHAIGYLSRFCSRPNPSHVANLIRTLQYAFHTRELGLLYQRVTPDEASVKTSNARVTPGSLKLCGYSDANWGSCTLTGRSTSAYVFTMNSVAISWKSKLQQCVALSTCESELLAVCEATKEGLYLRNFMEELGSDPFCLQIYTDNQSVLHVISNPVQTHRTRHISLRYFFIRDQAEEGVVSYHFLPSPSMPADALTKPAATPILKRCNALLGLGENPWKRDHIVHRVGTTTSDPLHNEGALGEQSA